jgi:hypothetical protein
MTVGVLIAIIGVFLQALLLPPNLQLFPLKWLSASPDTPPPALASQVKAQAQPLRKVAPEKEKK